MANDRRPGLRVIDRLVLLVAWLVTCGLVYLLGFYVGRGTQGHRLVMEERVVRLPVTSTPPPEGQRPKSDSDLTFYDTLVAGQGERRPTDGGAVAPSETPAPLAKAPTAPAVPAVAKLPAPTAAPTAAVKPAVGTPTPPAAAPLPPAVAKPAVVSAPSPAIAKSGAPTPAIPAAAKPASAPGPVAVAKATDPGAPAAKSMPPFSATSPPSVAPPPVTKPAASRSQASGPGSLAAASPERATTPPPASGPAVRGAVGASPVTAAATPPVAPRPASAAVPAPAVERAAPAVAAPAPVASAVTGSGWTVLASPTRSRDEAEVLLRQLRDRGYDAALVRVQRDGDAWYRLRVGRYATAAQAAVIMHKLREHEGVEHAFVANE